MAGIKAFSDGTRKKLKFSEDHVQATAKEFISFINTSPTPFHAVQESIVYLKNAGFKELNEKDPWDSEIKPNGRYFTVRNNSAIIAFAAGGKYLQGNGFNIIGAHTDSPCLKIKPVSKIESAGWLQVGVECYGGGLFHTWFDRDLGIAGRVFTSNKSENNSNESRDLSSVNLFEKMVLINKPILRIPTLAIHLDRDTANGFSFNKETQLRPILATAVEVSLGKSIIQENKSNNDADDLPKENHHSVLLDLLGKELNVSVSDIDDFELCLFDVQGANVGGILNEFIFSPRLDNLCCAWISIKALIKSLANLEDETNVRMVALFDNEEVGSNSVMGAGSNFLECVMKRISKTSDSFFQTASKSLLISADMAHGVHPNYSDKHEINHRPLLHKGPVIKYNANQRYATTGETAFLLKQIAKMHEIPIQEFVVRQDTGCGSTIGPILSTNTGIRTIDVGIAQLSMHSIREMCGTHDILLTMQWFEGFFKDFTKLDNKLHKTYKK